MFLYAKPAARPVPVGIALEGACLYRSSQDGSLYAFALGDGGEIDQYLLFEPTAGRVDAKLMRRLHVASTVEHCVADDSTGQLYVSEQGVGIWRFDAEPETEVLPVLVDAVRLGALRRFVKVFAADDDVRYLQGHDTPVPEGEKVAIIPALAGG